MANLTISYSLGDVAKTFKGANVYITAQNLFMITKYSGFDPEVNVDGSINGIPSLGIDYAHYPSSRSIIFGVNFPYNHFNSEVHIAATFLASILFTIIFLYSCTKLNETFDGDLTTWPTS